MKKLINKIIIKLIQIYLDKNKSDVIISHIDEKIDVEEAKKIVDDIDKEEQQEKYTSQFW